MAKNKKKNRASTAIRRLIENQRELESEKLSPLSWVDAEFDKEREAFQNQNDEILDDLNDSDITSNFELSDHEYLFVLEPSDLDELSLNEVKLVWERRNDLCGSIEAAAEALAILEIDSGITSSYKGWQTYIGHESLTELKALLSKRTTTTNEEESVKDISLIPPINIGLATPELNEIVTRDDIKNKSIQEVRLIWKNRAETNLSISAACETLAILRGINGIDKVQKHWSTFVEHEEIEKLGNLIEDEEPLINRSGTNLSDSEPASIAEKIIDDRRSKVRINAVVRLGQGKFRKIVLQHYRNKCCVSLCTETTLLEAAHISPYTGEHSNIIENSLCLRVDLHRLFDKLLLSINPANHKVQISKHIKDPYYKSLNGGHLKLQRNSLFNRMLDRHYKTFLKVEMGRN